jgi:hypothetical protein
MQTSSKFCVNDTALLVLSKKHFSTLISLSLTRMSNCIQSEHTAVFYIVCRQIETAFTLDIRERKCCVTVLEFSFKFMYFDRYLHTYGKYSNIPEHVDYIAKTKLKFGLLALYEEV